MQRNNNYSSSEDTDEDDIKYRTLYIGNLHENVTEKILEDIFIDAGPIVNVRIPPPKDGVRRNYGFVVYQRRNAAEYALALYQTTELFGQKVVLKINNSSEIRKWDLPVGYPIHMFPMLRAMHTPKATGRFGNNNRPMQHRNSRNPFRLSEFSRRYREMDAAAMHGNRIEQNRNRNDSSGRVEATGQSTSSTHSAAHVSRSDSKHRIGYGAAHTANKATDHVTGKSVAHGSRHGAGQSADRGTTSGTGCVDSHGLHTGRAHGQVERSEDANAEKNKPTCNEAKQRRKERRRERRKEKLDQRSNAQL